MHQWYYLWKYPMHQWYYLWKYPTSKHTTIEEEECNHCDTGCDWSLWDWLSTFSLVSSKSVPSLYTVWPTESRSLCSAAWHTSWLTQVNTVGRSTWNWASGSWWYRPSTEHRSSVQDWIRASLSCQWKIQRMSAMPWYTGCQNIDCQCHDTQTVSEVAIHRLSVKWQYTDCPWNGNTQTVSEVAIHRLSVKWQYTDCQLSGNMQTVSEVASEVTIHRLSV